MAQRIVPPRNEEAASSADETLYQNHEEDERPNPLYDAEGERQPINLGDPSQAEYRDEWLGAYDGAGGQVEEHPVTDDCPDDPVAPCTDDHVQPIVHRVEIFAHNESAAGQSGLQDWFQAIAPFSSDTVKLQAIVWASEDGSAQPYAYPNGFQNTGQYYCVCRGRPGQSGSSSIRDIRPDFWLGSGPPLMQGTRQLSGRTLQGFDKHHLPGPGDEDSFSILDWPSNWAHPQFVWEEVTYQAPSAGIQENRPYSYRFTGGTTHSPTDGSNGWTVTTQLPAGVHRIRVKVTARYHRPPADRGSARERSWPRQRDISSGYALHVMVREANIQEPDLNLPSPQGRAPAQSPPESIVTDYLQWMTAFLNVPYEYGGYWIGGRSGTGGNQDGYEGYGLDCTGLAAAAGYATGMRWGEGGPREAWRVQTHGGLDRQTRTRPVTMPYPVPSQLIWDPWNNWTEQGNGLWEHQGQKNPAPDVPDDLLLGIMVQPGDTLSSGPGARNGHLRTILEVLDRTSTNHTDARVRIIEASTSAGNVRTAETTLRTALGNDGTRYGLWRPVLSQGAPEESATDDPSTDPPES